MIRDQLLARLAKMGAQPDHQRLAEEVLGIRNAPPELARRLVAQALVVEDRREAWRRTGERICRDAPVTSGVYLLYDADGRPLYVGKAVNLRRRLRTHFSERRWRAMRPELSRAAGAEWRETGSDLEALLREADWIRERQPTVNVQIEPPSLPTREIPKRLLRDVVVLAPSVEADSVELIAARVAGPVQIQRTRRSGADLAVHAQRVMRFFRSPLRDDASDRTSAPIVFSWLAHRGASATRIHPDALASPRDLRSRLAALFRDDRLFHERLEQC